MVLGAVMAFSAAVLAWRLPKHFLPALLLLIACILGTIVWFPAALAEGLGALRSTSLAVAALSTWMAFWKVAFCPSDRRTTVLVGAIVCLTLGAWPLLPSRTWGDVPMRRLLFGAAETVYASGVGALALGAAWVLGPGRSTRRDVARRISATSLMLQTLALFLYGVGAQLAWGSYWRWEPLECWQLAAWLLSAILALVTWQLDWDGRRAALLLWLTTALALFVLLGAVPMARWLGPATFSG